MAEPDPKNFGLLSQRHGENKKLTLAQVAIGKERCVTALYVGGSSSTVVPATVDIYNSIPTLAVSGLDRNKCVNVTMYPMDDLCAIYGCPEKYDVLVIDVEGGEEDVLAGYDIARHRPTMAIVEAHELSPYKALRRKAVFINRYFRMNGYRKVYADTINNVYVTRRNYAHR